MIDFSNAEAALDYILELIALDEELVDKLPGVMKERAAWARAALAEGNENIDFGRYEGEKYTFAVLNPEDERWYDITGHYHFSSPSTSLEKRNKKALDWKCWLQDTRQIKREIRAEQSMNLDETSLRELADIYYARRKGIHQTQCSLCGMTPKRLIWHHVNVSILPAMRRAESKYRSAKDLGSFRKAYSEYIQQGQWYYLCPLGETVLICDKCHRAAHKKGD